MTSPRETITNKQQETFDYLYEKYVKLIKWHCWKCTNNADYHQDLVQEILIQLYITSDKIDISIDERALNVYVTTLIKHKLGSIYKKVTAAKRIQTNDLRSIDTPIKEGDEDYKIQLPSHNQLDDESEYNQLKEYILEILDNASPSELKCHPKNKERVLFIYEQHAFDNETYDDIGAVTGDSKQRIFQVYKTTNEYIKSQLGDEYL